MSRSRDAQRRTGRELRLRTVSGGRGSRPGAHDDDGISFAIPRAWGSWSGRGVDFQNRKCIRTHDAYECRREPPARRHVGFARIARALEAARTGGARESQHPDRQIAVRSATERLARI